MDTTVTTAETFAAICAVESAEVKLPAGVSWTGTGGSKHRDD
jgi:hypothetical protein